MFERSTRAGQDPLRAILQQDADAAYDEAVRNDGTVAPERLSRLQRMSDLLQVRQATRPPTRPARGRIVAAFAGTLLIASALLFLRVPSTEIELNAVVSELSFVAPGELRLTRPVDLLALGLAGGTTGSPGGPSGPVKIATVAADASLSLDPIVVPAGTMVLLRRLNQPRQYRLSFRSPTPRQMNVRAHFMGRVRLGSTVAPPEQLDSDWPRDLAFESDSNNLELDVTLAPDSVWSFAQRLAANGLRLVHVEDIKSSDRPAARPLSSVLSGALYFESLEGMERTLRRGEMVELEGAIGELRTTELDGTAIAVTFHGTVRGLQVGAGSRGHSIMPTWLDWLRHRHGLSLLWGAALYGFGLFTALRRWWKSPE